MNSTETSTEPTIESLQAEVAKLKNDLFEAQNRALNWEVTARTLTSSVAPAQLLAPPK